MVKFSVRKPLTVFVSVLAVIILGVVAFTKMTPTLFPNLDFPYVVIVTTYPGASPETVEAEVSKPMEQSMATLEHIESIESSSAENFSVVMLEFEDSVNMDTIGVDIQQAITALSGEWADAVGTPYILKINPSVLPVEVTAVSMDGMNTIELSDFVTETVIPRLDGVPGVARISTVGAVERQVHVVIDERMIEDVNRRLADSVNQQIDDAAAELAETKAELEEAQAALDEAQYQLDSGKAALIDQTAEAESTLNRQQVALLTGRMEIQSQLLTLARSRADLDTTLSIVRPIIAPLADIEARRAEADARIVTLQDTLDRLTAADEALAVFDDEIAAIEADETLDDAEKAVRIEDIRTGSEYVAAANEVAAAESALEDLGSSRYTAAADILSARAELAVADTELAAVDAALAALDLSREGIYDTVQEMETGIEQIDEAVALLNDTLEQLDSGAIQLSDAYAALSSAKSEGLLQLADTAAEINRNAGTVDTALAQVDSGLDSMEDSREDALASADIADTISLATVTSILAAQNFSMPAGTVEQDGVTYMVSVGDEMTDPEELEGLLLFDTGEDGIGPVYLSDVAAVFVTDNADESYARLNGENSLILSFEKQSNAATADVSDGLALRFEQLEEAYPGLHFVPLMDQGSVIYRVIRSILQSMLFGAVFAILILLLFLRDIRPTVITLVAIPVSLVFAFVLMYFSGVTLNMMSMSGLAIAVGMLVDNSIVVIENIFRLRSRGATALQAAVQGTKQVAGAVTASTLTTICVFLPLVFMEGITKTMFADIALTMTYSLLASLIIALTLVPAMARGMLGARRQDGKPEKKDLAGRFYRIYRTAVSWSLDHKWVVLPLAVVLLIVSVYAGLARGYSFMPAVDSNTVNATVVMPENATREEAVELADEVLARIADMDEVESVGAMMGGTSLLSTSESYNVTAYIELSENASGQKAGQELEALCADLPVTVDTQSYAMSMSALTGSGISVDIFGNDMEDLQAAAKATAQALDGVEGLTDTDDGLAEAQAALHIAVDRNAAMAKGYTVAQVYSRIAAELTSSAASIRLDMGDVTADVIVSDETGLTADDLMELSFDYTNADGDSEPFALRDIAELADTVSLSTIRRIGQRRCVTVQAAVEDGYNVTLLAGEAQQAVAALTLPSGVTYSFDGENEAIMDAVRQVLQMLLMAFALVYFVMVAQFQSLKSPFIVMFTIPLAFTGGFLALLLFGLDVSVVVLIGFVMLSGVIVNNGIVLVDCVNQLRADGMERRAALIEAGTMRLRPILMTSLTTVLGLIHMATGRSIGTSFIQPAALVCIGGLLYATLMTLIVVPCIYDILNKKALTVVRDEDMEYTE